MLPLEGDEEIKLEPKETIAERVKVNPKKYEGTGLKTFTLNKLLIRLLILLAEIKAENNLYKLKNEIRQILYLLSQDNEITKKVCNKFKSL